MCVCVCTPVQCQLAHDDPSSKVSGTSHFFPSNLACLKDEKKLFSGFSGFKCWFKGPKFRTASICSTKYPHLMLTSFPFSVQKSSCYILSVQNRKQFLVWLTYKIKISKQILIRIANYWTILCTNYEQCCTWQQKHHSMTVHSITSVEFGKVNLIYPTKTTVK